MSKAKVNELISVIRNLSDLLKSSDLSFLLPHLEKLQNLNEKLDKNEVIIPFLGEFSSGKSSIINSLIGKKVLPIDITPTTFTVNEIKFSSEKDLIEIYYKSGLVEKHENIMALDSIDYKNATLVRIYLKDKILPNNITLVDIPGFSSIIEEHDEVISSYLPKADCIFLINDINQATITKTASKFIDYVKNLEKEIFLILSKSDTKSESEINEVGEYFYKNFPIFNKIITTSAKKNYIEEILQLVNEVNIRANEINFKSGTKNFNQICESVQIMLSQHLEDTKLDLNEIEQKLKDTQNRIRALEIEFDNKVKKLKNGIEEAKTKAVSNFQRYLLSKKDTLVDMFFSKSKDFQREFKNSIEEAIEKSARLFEREVKICVEDFKNDIDLITNDLKGTTAVHGILTGISETLTISLINLILPGGLIYALIGRVVLLIIEKIPRIGKFAGTISTVINSIVEIIGKVIAKSYISNKIQDAFIKATESFNYEITEMIELMYKEIENNLKKEFNTSLKICQDSMNQLYMEKQNSEKEFKQYRERIEDLISQVRKICNYI